MNNQKTVQDYLNKMLLEDKADDNETVQVLEFVRDNGVPLTNDQARGIFLLNQMGLADIAEYAMTVRKQMTPNKWYFKMVEMMTLSHRIKGSAKLNNVLKQQANPGAGLNTEKAARGGS